MTRDQALAKVAKCLALSRSANEHEAAAALRQAQALMREHAIDADDIELSQVGEAAVPSRSSALNKWEALLAEFIGDAFGTAHFSLKLQRLLGGRYCQGRDWVFVGTGAAPQIAAYAYDVLSRQCAAARATHIRKQPGSCKPITKTARGDRFAVGWVLAVRALVARFAGNPRDQVLIERYLADKHPELTSVKPRDTAVGRNVRDADLDAGFQAGKKAELHKGVGAAARPLALGASRSAGRG